MRYFALGVAIGLTLIASHFVVAYASYYEGRAAGINWARIQVYGK